VKLGDAHGGRNRATFDLHLEADIVYLREAIGGREGASFKMDLEAAIELNSQMHLEAVIE
jgi:hypothetical protein